MSENLLITLVIPGVILFVIVVIYNGIVSRKNAVKRAWADVITQERQKNKTIPHLEEVVEQYKAHESGVLTQITELRSALQDLSSGDIDTGKLAAVEASSARLLSGLNVVVENYPDLKASETFNNLMREISEQQENISAAIRIFNQNVEDFNNGIEIFPNSLVNSMLNRQSPYQVFTDSEAQEGFEYSPTQSG